MDFRGYQNKFREGHSEFYEKLRSYFRYKSVDKIFKEEANAVVCNLDKITKKLSKGNYSKYNSASSQISKKALYSYLLNQHIKGVFENLISDFLRDIHNLNIEKDFGNLTLRGVVYLHSDEFGEGEPMSIPFGIWNQSDIEANVTSEVFNLRHSVKHFLGESIWRFFKPGELNVPLLLFNGKKVGFDHALNIELPTFTKKEELEETLLNDRDVLKDWPNNFYKTLSQHCDNWKENEDAIVEKTVAILNKWLPDKTLVDDDNSEKDLVFLIDGHRDSYRNCDCKFLLANPIRQHLINDVTNIIYIPDIHRNKITGGLVCELSGEALKMEKPKFKAMLEDLQWLFSDYIISPISSCEAEFNTGEEETYVDKYFTKISVFETFKGEILKGSKEIADSCGTEESDGKVAIYDALKYFFESVSTKRGNAIRGYREISQKVFVTVCKLWNASSAYTLTGGMKIFPGNLKDIEVDVRAFNQIKHSQPALHLIYLALDFEGTLKNVPSYREHFIHSFHVYCLGMWLVYNPKHPYQKIFSENDLYFKQWFIAALWHDISYALQKLPEISNIFIRNLISHGYHSPQKKELVPITPNWGHLLLVKDFYKLLLGESSFKESIEKIFADFTTVEDKQTALAYIKFETDEAVTDAIENVIEVKLADILKKEINDGRELTDDIRNKFKVKIADEELREALTDVISGKLLEKMLSEADHSVLSGLILYHQMCNTDETVYKKGIEKNKNNYKNGSGNEDIASLFNLIKCNNKHKENESCPNCLKHNKFIEVIVAIMLHSSHEWKPNDIEHPPWRINFKNAPIAHLLMLCDTFVQSGRDFREANDPMKIYFESLTMGVGAIETATIRFSYYKKTDVRNDDWVKHSSKESDDIREKHFDKPLALLKGNKGAVPGNISYQINDTPSKNYHYNQ